MCVFRVVIKCAPSIIQLTVTYSHTFHVTFTLSHQHVTYMYHVVPLWHADMLMFIQTSILYIYPWKSLGNLVKYCRYSFVNFVWHLLATQVCTARQFSMFLHATSSTGTTLVPLTLPPFLNKVKVRINGKSMGTVNACGVSTVHTPYPHHSKGTPTHTSYPHPSKGTPLCTYPYPYPVPPPF